ncbi:AAA family ATPase [Mycobacterium sp. B14F4]|uniref:helix-turn-helix transcriptional regulator n=1 Tax=Mycobacterium sp. B14F4 TaxID=3153565 RepID=UPI00325DAB21
MARGVIERPTEFRAIFDFLRSASSRPAGVVIEGEAGVGKTTLWLTCVAEALKQGFRVLSARGAQAEAAFAYAAVADLLSDVEPSVLADLPELQRLAVDRVLLRADGDGPPTDQGVAAAALGSVVNLLAARSPVLVAIDDVQWLDPSSHAVVASAARQITGRVGILVTERREHEKVSAAERLQLASPEEVGRIGLGPLSLGALHALISARLSRSLPRPTLVRIGEISGGNPFYALELAHAIEAGGSDSMLPATLAELMRQRIGRLERETRVLLLAAACAAAPTIDLLARVTGSSPERICELLDEAKRKGIAAIDGDDVRFTHPLLARSVYADATPRERRAMHRKLAEAVEFPESRARHMALAASSSDPTTLAALDSASQAARDRGAPAAAADLLELAIGLGGDTPARRLRAAGHHLHAGDLGHAHALLDGMTQRIPPGLECAMAQNLLAIIRIHNNDFGQAVKLLEQALENAQGNREVRVGTLLQLAYARLNTCDFGAALQEAERAVVYAEDVGNPDLESQALSFRAAVACICGHGIDEASLRHALALEDPNSYAPIAFRASTIKAMLLAWGGHVDEASEQMAQVHHRCVERGSEIAIIFVDVLTALIEIWRGNYQEAARVADETMERADQLGGDHMRVLALTVQSAVAAYRGREAETRDSAAAAIGVSHRSGSPRLAEWAMISLGFLEVSLGRHEQALQILQPLIARSDLVPGTEIMTAGYIPDAVEAMIALGRAADAEPMIEALETNGRMVDRPWMLAVGARCRSLLLAARGDVTAAVQSAEQALVHHDRLPMPFERARTLLVLGRLRRRNRQKESARAALTEAITVFDVLGASLWAERGRAELDRINASPNKQLGLTPSEHRVASLAASGLTTREIADELFISPKTVETNFARIYRKLGIKSRAELGRLIGHASRRAS